VTVDSLPLGERIHLPEDVGIEEMQRRFPGPAKELIPLPDDLNVLGCITPSISLLARRPRREWRLSRGAALRGRAEPRESGVRVIAFETLRPGEALLHLVKRRPWEPELKEEFTVRLRVEAEEG
jgi:hypothetical protein